MSGPGKKRCRPRECLIESGAYRAMTKPEQNYVGALDFFTNRDSGLCYPSERIITERFGLSRSRQKEGRKRRAALPLAARSLEKRLFPGPRTTTQFRPNPDPI
jgi:hypothetical protein